MASIPVTQPATKRPGETIEQRFRRLEGIWTAATGYLSNPDEIMNHPALREIISMGDVVVGFMLRDLENKPGLWVWTLPEITGTDPVPVEDRGNIAKMSAAWVRWGKEHGYQW